LIVQERTEKVKPEQDNFLWSEVKIMMISLYLFAEKHAIWLGTVLKLSKGNYFALLL
jgi:hypothetical protein